MFSDFAILLIVLCAVGQERGSRFAAQVEVIVKVLRHADSIVILECAVQQRNHRVKGRRLIDLGHIEALDKLPSCALQGSDDVEHGLHSSLLQLHLLVVDMDVFSPFLVRAGRSIKHRNEGVLREVGVQRGRTSASHGSDDRAMQGHKCLKCSTRTKVSTRSAMLKDQRARQEAQCKKQRARQGAQMQIEQLNLEDQERWMEQEDLTMVVVVL